MTEHTPGPWRVYIEPEIRTPDAYEYAYIAGVQGPDGEWIFRYDDDYGETMAANARLIAAAPELLVALKDITTGLNMHNIRLLGLEDAKAAIAKAEAAS